MKPGIDCQMMQCARDAGGGVGDGCGKCRGAHAGAECFVLQELLEFRDKSIGRRGHAAEAVLEREVHVAALLPRDPIEDQHGRAGGAAFHDGSWPALGD